MYIVTDTAEKPWHGMQAYLQEPGQPIGLCQAVQAVHNGHQGAVADKYLAALALAEDGGVGVKVVGCTLVRPPALVEEQVQWPACSSTGSS